MTRRTPTPEQKRAVEERRAKMRELAQVVSKMTEAERQAIADRAGGVVTIEGRRLSLFNTVFALQQDGGASVLGGFQQWRTAGRCVRKGEHAIAIWAPIKGGEAEAVEPGQDDEARPRFILVSMFDIAQTDPIAVVEAAEIAEAA